ncbi:helix-turn-helix transcriptional regulator [Riemerella anatipestifer]|uniref:S24 family peptidase n=1 Tax=Riemerella anatipestifer TaxID=34085 RepID=UPI00129D82CF|nr:S24 family peptidase [Riemerella anatipestifer]MRM94376.1 helix-turn-helix transcriptional regulator [Riemerella anatipestifer]
MKKEKNTRKYNHYLYDFILHLKLNPKSFAESLGFERTDRIYNVLKGANGISSDLASIISDKYPDVIYEWLLTGKGEMLKSSEESPIKGDEVKAVPYDNYMMVEYADLGTSAGTLGGDNPAYLPETKRRLVPKEFDSGNYLVVGVYGDSMDDGSSISIPHGTEILIKEYILSNGEKLPIRNNLFVIVSRSGTVFKQIIEHNTEEGYIICRSYNPKYKDYKILLEEVIQIFVFRKVVSYRPFIPEIN